MRGTPPVALALLFAFCSYNLEDALFIKKLYYAFKLYKSQNIRIYKVVGDS
jgi:hypothetical protein